MSNTTSNFDSNCTMFNSEEISALGELSEDGKLIVQLLSNKFDAVVEKYTALLKQKEERISKLEGELSSVRKTLTAYEERLNTCESQERKLDLIISGPDVPEATVNENCKRVVCNLIKEKLKVNVKAAEIASAVQIGKTPQTQQPDRRNILIRVNDTEIKKWHGICM